MRLVAVGLAQVGAILPGENRTAIVALPEAEPEPEVDEVDEGVQMVESAKKNMSAMRKSTGQTTAKTGRYQGACETDASPPAA